MRVRYCLLASDVVYTYEMGLSLGMLIGWIRLRFQLRLDKGILVLLLAQMFEVWLLHEAA